MADRDSPAVDVDLVLGKTQIPHRGDTHAGEGLVDLYDIEIGDRERAVTTQGVHDGGSRLEQQ